MRGVIVSVIIAAVMISGSILYSIGIRKISEELGSINDGIMICLTDENYEGAKDELIKLIEYLERNSTMLAATGNHEEFNKIEINIYEMSGYINGRQKTDAVSRCKVLDFLFEHIPKNYELKLENIL